MTTRRDILILGAGAAALAAASAAPAQAVAQEPTYYLILQSSPVIGDDALWIVRCGSIAEALQRKLDALCSLHGDEPKSEGWLEHAITTITPHSSFASASADAWSQDWEAIGDGCWYLPA